MDETQTDNNYIKQGYDNTEKTINVMVISISNSGPNILLSKDLKNNYYFIKRPDYTKEKITISEPLYFDRIYDKTFKGSKRQIVEVIANIETKTARLVIPKDLSLLETTIREMQETLV